MKELEVVFCKCIENKYVFFEKGSFYNIRKKGEEYLYTDYEDNIWLMEKDIFFEVFELCSQN